MWFTEQLNIRARGASYPAVTDTDIFSLIIPLPNDENLLSAFDSLIADIQSLYEQAHRASDHIEKLFSLLLERAFSGQLTAKWREAHIKELLAEMEQQARLLNLPLPKELEAAP
jgi:type I restriction enzyme S subunit